MGGDVAVVSDSLERVRRRHARAVLGAAPVGHVAAGEDALVAHPVREQVEPIGDGGERVHAVHDVTHTGIPRPSWAGRNRIFLPVESHESRDA